MRLIRQKVLAAVILAGQVIVSSACTASPIALGGSQPVPLIQGSQVGKGIFPAGDTSRGGNGQTIDGIEGGSQEMLKTHFHSHLSLFHKGVKIAVPAGIGIVKPLRINRGFVESGKGYYWLHTHDASGILHVESPDNRSYTLGNFFDIWGQSLDARGAAGFRGTVRVYVNGRLAFTPAREVPLRAHDQITLEIGSPLVTPTTYAFPEGL